MDGIGGIILHPNMLQPRIRIQTQFDPDIRDDCLGIGTPEWLSINRSETPLSTTSKMRQWLTAGCSDR